MAPSMSEKSLPRVASTDGLAALTSINTPNSAAPAENTPVRRILKEEDAYHVLGFSFSPLKKWSILTCIFIVQISMNFNAAIYGNAGEGMMAEFGISQFTFKIGQMIFLVAYAFGCELWAPWSEEMGRKWVLQGSLGLVNLWQLPCALAPKFWVVMLFRGLGGLSSAGGSVTLGMVADMWEPEVQQYAVAFVVLSSVAGSVVAPIVGGVIQTYLSWQWVFWIQLIFGVVAQAIHLCVPETRSDVLLDRHAKMLRKTGADPNIYGPNEHKGNLWKRLDWKESSKLMLRPYKFLATEPIVLFLSLLSGFSDALIFTGLDSFPLVLAKWDFTVIQVGLAFISLLVGHVIAYLLFLPRYRCDIKLLRVNPSAFKPERRLWLLLFLVLLEPVGLMMFGFGSLGPPVPWIVPLIGASLIGIANFAIYMATIDYMIAAYGPFAASATGGNGFCRDFLAGIAALYTRPLYTSIKPGTNWQLPIPTLILCAIGVLLCIPVFVFYFWGEWFRKRSPYAQELEHEREEKREVRKEAISESKKTTPANSRPNTRPSSPTRVDEPMPDRSRSDLRVLGNSLEITPV
ncbi:hypothetical protein LTR37_011772 [Vermiconidia calcicola]|uniref:Uncharacterized protein n=1 Tax=Vermiconidia calcicola TaxID=1690605 RepID=A0ACC3N141_9PEZI|nr:hypothetical protein LTR37_011772 [Vermiconidia calcicola]